MVFVPPTSKYRGAPAALPPLVPIPKAMFRHQMNTMFLHFLDMLRERLRNPPLAIEDAERDEAEHDWWYLLDDTDDDGDDEDADANAEDLRYEFLASGLISFD